TAEEAGALTQDRARAAHADRRAPRRVEREKQRLGAVGRHAKTLDHVLLRLDLNLTVRVHDLVARRGELVHDVVVHICEIPLLEAGQLAPHGPVDLGASVEELPLVARAGPLAEVHQHDLGGVRRSALTVVVPAGQLAQPATQRPPDAGDVDLHPLDAPLVDHLDEPTDCPHRILVDERRLTPRAHAAALTDHSAVGARADVDARLDLIIIVLGQLQQAALSHPRVRDDGVRVRALRELAVDLRPVERRVASPLLGPVLRPAPRDEVDGEILGDLLTREVRGVLGTNVNDVPRGAWLTLVLEDAGTVRVADRELPGVLVRRQRRALVPQRLRNAVRLVVDDQEVLSVHALEGRLLVVRRLTTQRDELPADVPRAEVADARQAEPPVQLTDLIPEDSVHLCAGRSGRDDARLAHGMHVDPPHGGDGRDERLTTGVTRVHSRVGIVPHRLEDLFLLTPQLEPRALLRPRDGVAPPPQRGRVDHVGRERPAGASGIT